MMSKNNFAGWLKQHRNLGASSIGKYTRSIDRLSVELKDYGLEEESLYKITNPEAIDLVLRNPRFQEKNDVGHRMYSSALNHFKNYILHCNFEEVQPELLKEEAEFEKYLREIPSETRVIDEAEDRPEHKVIGNRKVWKRNPKHAIDAVAYANYLCEFDSDHQHFISKFSEKNYVEAHHLIPIGYQDRFDYSLDVHANIVSLCLICHKKLHYGLFDEKKEILDKLYHSRKKRLEAAKIEIALDELYSYYD